MDRTTSPAAEAETLPRVGPQAVAYRNSLPEYLEGRRLLYGHLLYAKMAFFLLIVLGVWGFMLWKIPQHGGNPVPGLIMFGGMGVLMLLIMPLLDRRTASAWFRSDPAAGERMQAEWDEAGITLENPTYGARCLWRDLHRCRSGKRVIAMNWDNGINIFLPNRPEIAASLAACRDAAGLAAGPAPQVAVIPPTAPRGTGPGWHEDGEVLEFRLSPEQAAEPYRLLRYLQPFGLGLVIVTGMLAFRSWTDKGTIELGTIALCALPGAAVLAAIMGFRHLRNRKLLAKTAGSAWDVVLAWDRQRFIYRAGSRADAVPWSSISRVIRSGSVIEIYAVQTRLMFLLPDETRLRDLLRDHAPQTAKWLR